jgi:hypothetical protein
VFAQATIPVPPDACSMNFVFHNGVGPGAIYDNRGDLDYYLPVAGGVRPFKSSHPFSCVQHRSLNIVSVACRFSQKGADGKQVVEAPLHVVHICVEMAPIAKVTHTYHQLHSRFFLFFR